ncbi:21962_t:CDS:2, partial [Gigaspora margarita]
NTRSYSASKMPASSNNINDNRNQRSKNNKLGSEYKNNKNFISRDKKLAEELTKELIKELAKVLIKVLAKVLVK